MNTLHEDLVERLFQQLKRLEPSEKRLICGAYVGKDHRALVPFVGSGLNSLAEQEPLSWKALVKLVATGEHLRGCSRRRRTLDI